MQHDAAGDEGRRRRGDGIPKARDSCALIGACSAISMPATMPTSDQRQPIIAITSLRAQRAQPRCANTSQTPAADSTSQPRIMVEPPIGAAIGNSRVGPQRARGDVAREQRDADEQDERRQQEASTG